MLAYIPTAKIVCISLEIWRLTFFDRRHWFLRWCRSLAQLPALPMIGCLRHSFFLFVLSVLSVVFVSFARISSCFHFPHDTQRYLSRLFPRSTGMFTLFTLFALFAMIAMFDFHIEWVCRVRRLSFPRWLRNLTNSRHGSPLTRLTL